MTLFRIPVELTVTHKRCLYVEAPSKEEAHEAAIKKQGTLTWESQDQEYYVKTPVPVATSPRVDIVA